MTPTDFWKILAGLGMFLYGMFRLEDTLRQMEGRAFKLFLQKHTKNKLSAIFSGTVVTGILQSSSVVNLIVLSFVGAGMLTMSNAIGVTLGANIGGTFNSWLVALLGFKTDIAKFALPIIGISGIGLVVFRNKKKLYRIANLCFAFGLLFLGLEYIKEGMDSLLTGFDFTPYLSYNRIVFVLIGFVITALVQTSSATVVIVLSALYATIIPIETAVAVILGAELGTTIKLLIGSIGGIAAKRRVAFGNILFNIITSSFGFIFLVPIIILIRDKIGLHDPLLVLVAFQTFINVTGVIAFYFFLGPYGRYLEKCFKDKEKSVTYYLKAASPTVPDIAMEMLQKEVELFVFRVIHLNMEGFHIEDDQKNKEKFSELIEKTKSLTASNIYIEKYQEIKKAEGEILTFYSKIAESEIDPKNLIYLNQLMSVVRNAMYSAKGMKDILADQKEFSNSINVLKFDIYTNFRLQLSDFYSKLNTAFLETNSSSVSEQLGKLLAETKTEYETGMINSYKDVEKNSLMELDISTLFNVNRELYSSCKAIILAVKKLLTDANDTGATDNNLDEGL
ncbi:hypothetical protein BH09BAC5_BH09BAC5_03070 [soil metagenome]